MNVFSSNVQTIT